MKWRMIMSDEYKVTLEITPNSRVSKKPFEASTDLDEVLGEFWDDCDCDFYRGQRDSASCTGKIHLSSGLPGNIQVRREADNFYSQVRAAVLSVLGPSTIDACFRNLDICDFNIEE
jgi:hypothetical protein